MVEHKNESPSSSDTEMDEDANYPASDVFIQKQSEFYEEQIRTGEDVRQESEVVFLKNFNNFIKSLLIGEYTFKAD